MTLQQIRENLEDARDNGLPWRCPGHLDYDMIKPELHVTKLYSICEGLIAEIERLQVVVDELLRHQHQMFTGAFTEKTTRPIGLGSAAQAGAAEVRIKDGKLA